MQLKNKIYALSDQKQKKRQQLDESEDDNQINEK